MKGAKKTAVPVSVEIVPAPTRNEEFSQARVYANAMLAMAHGAGAIAVLLGGELERLHKLFCGKRGRRWPGSSNSATRGGIMPWDDLVKAEVGISETHSRRCRELFREAKKRLPEFSLMAAQLLDTPLRDLPDLQRAELIERTHKILPHEGLRQLMWEWNVCRGTRGGDNTPRDASGKRISDRRRTKAEIEREEFEEEAEASCSAARNYLRQLLGVSGPKEERAWFVLEDDALLELKQLAYDSYRGLLEFETQRGANARRGRKAS